MKTISERVDGLEFNQGYLSPYMITDNQRMEAVFDKALILVTSYRLTNANDVIPLMNKMIAAGKRQLLIIADGVEADALATLIVNRVEGKFIAVAVQAPQTENKKQFLEDICLLTGATLFTEDKGNRVDQAEIAQLGKADRAIIRDKKTTIVGGKGNKGAIEKERMRIKTAIENNPKPAEKDALELRLARLINGVAVVKVGAPTEAEAKALKYKVEDAINATRSALSGGVVCGSGIGLLELKTSSPILNKALHYPFKQLKENMGIEDLHLKAGEAYNAVTGEKGPFLKVGVIDPVEVLIAGIESAVSIASMLVTTHGILVEESPKEDKK
jgi:chaperonin GroEL